jgi:hypothetical protein
MPSYVSALDRSSSQATAHVCSLADPFRAPARKAALTGLSPPQRRAGEVASRAVLHLDGLRAVRLGAVNKYESVILGIHRSWLAVNDCTSLRVTPETMPEDLQFFFPRLYIGLES